MFQLNARVPQETKEQLDKLVEHFSRISIGRVSQGAVLQEIIKKAYEQVEKEKVQKN